jgi:hypothetical protein
MRSTSPSRWSLDGSPTRHQSMRSPRARSACITRAVPSTASPSSSLVSRKPIEPAVCGQAAKNRSTATTMAASAPFMSAAPRPINSPSRSSAANGSQLQAPRSPTGTTSVWPANTNSGPVAPRRAHRLSTAPNRMGSSVKPSVASRAPSSA